MRKPKVRTVEKSVYAIHKKRAKDLNTQICPPVIPTRVTRSLQRLLDNFHLIILENYRCMPLLGDEEKVPNWDVHIVRYSVVFVKNENVEGKKY